MTNDRKPGAGQGVSEVVSRLGRIVKERVREFAAEADEQFRETLAQTREDLDAELGTERKRVDPTDADPEGHSPSDAPPPEGRDTH